MIERKIIYTKRKYLQPVKCLTDGVVYDEHTDNVYGYKNNPSKNIEEFRKYITDNTIKTIVEECLNTITYSIYMF